ncbi:MAG: hypothetical protein ACT6R6_18710, partial [Flavobacterium sp.]|uniref:hypothetical protein n=1 Tax=Flavobacterium sp. TaxID=239 RepID=UPI0040349246
SGVECRVRAAPQAVLTATCSPHTPRRSTHSKPIIVIIIIIIVIVIIVIVINITPGTQKQL